MPLALGILHTFSTFVPGLRAASSPAAPRSSVGGVDDDPALGEARGERARAREATGNLLHRSRVFGGDVKDDGGERLNRVEHEPSEPRGCPEAPGPGQETPAHG